MIIVVRQSVAEIPKSDKLQNQLRKMIRLIGHVLSVILLVIGSLSIKIVDTIIRLLVNMIKSMTGAKIEKDSMKFHVQREEVRPEYENKEIGDIDVKTTLSKSSYPFSPEDLIKKVKVMYLLHIYLHKVPITNFQLLCVFYRS